MAVEFGFPVEPGGKLSRNDTGIGSIVHWFSMRQLEAAEMLLSFVAGGKHSLRLYCRNLFAEKELEAILVSRHAKVLERENGYLLIEIDAAQTLVLLLEIQCEEVLIFPSDPDGIQYSDVADYFDHTCVPRLLQLAPKIAFYEGSSMSLQVYFGRDQCASAVSMLLSDDAFFNT